MCFGKADTARMKERTRDTNTQNTAKALANARPHKEDGKPETPTSTQTETHEWSRPQQQETTKEDTNHPLPQGKTHATTYAQTHAQTRGQPREQPHTHHVDLPRGADTRLNPDPPHETPHAQQRKQTHEEAHIVTHTPPDLPPNKQRYEPRHSAPHRIISKQDLMNHTQHNLATEALPPREDQGPAQPDQRDHKEMDVQQDPQGNVDMMNGQGGGAAAHADEEVEGEQEHAGVTTIAWELNPALRTGGNNGQAAKVIATGIKRFNDAPFIKEGTTPPPECNLEVTVRRTDKAVDYFNQGENVAELEETVQRLVGHIAPNVVVHALNFPNGIDTPQKSDLVAGIFPHMVTYAAPQKTAEGTRLILKFAQLHEGTPDLKFNSNHILGEDFTSTFTRAEYTGGGHEPAKIDYKVKCRGKSCTQFIPSQRNANKKSFPLGYFRLEVAPKNSIERNDAFSSIYEELMSEIGDNNVGLGFSKMKDSVDTVIWLSTYEQDNGATKDLENSLRLRLQSISGLKAFDSLADYQETTAQDVGLPLELIMEIKAAQDLCEARRFYSLTGEIEGLVSAVTENIKTTGNTYTKVIHDTTKNNLIVYNNEGPDFGTEEYKNVVRFTMTYMKEHGGIKNGIALDKADEQRLTAAIRTQSRKRTTKATVDFAARKQGMAKRLKMDQALKQELEQRVTEAQEQMMEDFVTDTMIGGGAGAST